MPESPRCCALQLGTSPPTRSMFSLACPHVNRNVSCLLTHTHTHIPTNTHTVPMPPGVRPTSPLSPASSQLRKQALKDFGYLTGRMVQHLGPVDLTNILVCPGVSATLLPLLALGPSDVVEHLKTMLGAAFPEQGGVRVPCLALCAVVLMVPGLALHECL
jgi:hypothetical protein